MGEVRAPDSDLLLALRRGIARAHLRADDRPDERHQDGDLRPLRGPLRHAFAELLVLVIHAPVLALIDGKAGAKLADAALHLGFDRRIALLALFTQAFEHVGNHVADVAELGDAEAARGAGGGADADRSEEHTSELQSLMRNSYAVFCLKQQNQNK